MFKAPEIRGFEPVLKFIEKRKKTRFKTSFVKSERYGKVEENYLFQLERSKFNLRAQQIKSVDKLVIRPVAIVNIFDDNTINTNKSTSEINPSKYRLLPQIDSDIKNASNEPGFISCTFSSYHFTFIFVLIVASFMCDIYMILTLAY